MNRLKLGIVSCGFLGCAPVAPGTFGTLGGVLIAWLLAPSAYFLPLAAGSAILVYFLGRSLAGWSERHAGKKDPGFFVLDEVVGYLVTVLWVGGPSLLTLLLGFLAFRFFDIAKPPPVRRLERVPGGDGILLDDVAAGVYGWLVLGVLRMVFPDLAWTV